MATPASHRKRCTSSAGQACSLTGRGCGQDPREFVDPHVTLNHLETDLDIRQIAAHRLHHTFLGLAPPVTDEIGRCERLSTPRLFQAFRPQSVRDRQCSCCLTEELAASPIPADALAIPSRRGGCPSRSPTTRTARWHSAQARQRPSHPRESHHTCVPARNSLYKSMPVFLLKAVDSASPLVPFGCTRPAPDWQAGWGRPACTAASSIWPAAISLQTTTRG